MGQGAAALPGIARPDCTCLTGRRCGSSGANLAQPVDGTPAWSQFPLKLQDAAAPANAIALTHARAELDALEAAGQAIDEHGVRWWRVWFRATNGKSLFGWVCGASHPGTNWESPWAWPGFETVDATGIDLVDAFRRNLVITGSAEGAEAKTFEPAVLAVNRSPLLQKLDQTVTRAEAPGQDGKVTAVAMQAALRVPALAHALSRVILRYESEWGGNMARWQAITPAMRNGGANWVKELGRIEKLQWWNEVKGKVAGFPQSATVLHVHPIALVANFICGCNCVNVEEFLRIYETQHSSFEPGTPSLDTTSKEHLRILIQGILSYYTRYKNGACNIPRIAYMLATARLETKKKHADINKFIYFEPTTESGSISYFNRYDPILADTETRRQTAVQNGNTNQGDGYTYRGRGYVQVTWKNNYQKIGHKIGIDLVNSPERMLEPEIAAWATVYGMEEGLFTGRKLSDYITDTGQDYVHARRIINRLDQADKIASFAEKFKSILESSKCGN